MFDFFSSEILVKFFLYENKFLKTNQTVKTKIDKLKIKLLRSNSINQKSNC